uniref:Uncharacterized protein n=1 Tax=Cacopsylla melanoneura TaxID=428564 RepID=A0A8D9BZ54_9HEMI
MDATNNMPNPILSRLSHNARVNHAVYTVARSLPLSAAMLPVVALKDVVSMDSTDVASRPVKSLTIVCVLYSLSLTQLTQIGHEGLSSLGRLEYAGNEHLQVHEFWTIVAIMRLMSSGEIFLENVKNPIDVNRWVIQKVRGIQSVQPRI